jgi:hypothetical protein
VGGQIYVRFEAHMSNFQLNKFHLEIHYGAEDMSKKSPAHHL